MTMMIVPRTHTQRMAALERANRIRICRALVKQHLRKGSADPVSLLMNTPEELELMKVYTLLRAVPKIGEAKALQILRACAISHSKTLKGMSDRQRSELVSLLELRKAPSA